MDLNSRSFNRAFCTIITSEYIPFAKSLFQSLRKYDSNIDTFALIVDSIGFSKMDDLRILGLRDLSDSHLVDKIFDKYSDKVDPLRWSLKSVLMAHLLKIFGYDQVYYVDSDLYFFGDFRFLYDELGNSSFLLSPHWGCIHPNKSELYFSHFMTNGLYNAGFVGATIKGLSTLYWWAEMCIYACEKDKSRGLHDDQTYLNLFPILSPDSKIIHHKGCNVADWNRMEIQRGLSPEGQLVLDSVYQLVFIHFTELGYLVENDPLLIPYLEMYEQELQKNGLNRSIISPAKNFVFKERMKRLNFLERLVRRAIGGDRFSKLKRWKL